MEGEDNSVKELGLPSRPDTSLELPSSAMAGQVDHGALRPAGPALALGSSPPSTWCLRQDSAG